MDPTKVLPSSLLLIILLVSYKGSGKRKWSGGRYSLFKQALQVGMGFDGAEVFFGKHSEVYFYLFYRDN